MQGPRFYERLTEDPSFEAQIDRTLGYSPDREMSRLAGLSMPCGRAMRVWVILAIAGLILSSAAAERQIIPGLKSVYKSPTVARHVSSHKAKLPKAFTRGHGGVLPTVALRFLARTFTYAPVWMGASFVVAPREATALGMPKRLRWLMLGGHGRHGAG